VADVHVPIRAGSDIAFLGGIINYILENERYFRDYVVNYTNAAAILTDEYQDTEEHDGLFGGWEPEKGEYQHQNWMYEGVEPQAAAGARESASGTGKEYKRRRPIPRCRIPGACFKF
jgi:formate dehydrogenase major subunit